jgi:hypothetical protein
MISSRFMYRLSINQFATFQKQDRVRPVSPRPKTEMVPIGSRLVLVMVGLSLPISIRFMGELYAGELFLLLFVAGQLVFRPRTLSQWPRYMQGVLLALVLMITGYMLSDAIAGTQPLNYLRGWARVFFLGVNIAGLYMIVRGSSDRLIWLTLGFAWSSVVIGIVALHSEPFVVAWKLDLGFPVTLATVSLLLLGRYSRRYMAPAALFALGALHLVLDSRSMGAGCILCACLQLSRVTQMRRWRLISYGVTMAILALGIGVVAYTYVEGSAEFAKRRLNSNNGRFAGLIISAREIAKSPVFGHGSWSGFDSGAVNLYQVELRKAGVKLLGKMDFIGAHSQVLQAWYEGGLLAVIFPFYFGFLLIKGMRAFRRKEVSLLSSALLIRLLLLNSSWSLMLSPLSGMHRIYIGLGISGVTVALKAAEVRERVALRPSLNVHGAPSRMFSRPWIYADRRNIRA